MINLRQPYLIAAKTLGGTYDIDLSEGSDASNLREKMLASEVELRAPKQAQTAF